MKRPSTSSHITWLVVAALAGFAVYKFKSVPASSSSPTTPAPLELFDRILDVEDGMIRACINHPNSTPTPTS